MARDRAARPAATPLRLFVAVELSEEAGRAIDRAIAPWRAAFPRARWVPSENRHVTLRFLGRTWPRLRGWVEDRVREAARGSAAFSVRLEGLGAFPSERRARVLWVGLDDADERLAALAALLEVGLADAFPAERRPFTPHVTVARSDPPLALPEEYRGSTVEPVEVRVEEIVLFRSHLARPAPRYEALARFPLGG